MKTSTLILTLLSGLITMNVQAKEKTPPFVGNQYEVHYSPDNSFNVNWQTTDTMTYTVLAGSKKGKAETVKYTAKLIQPNVYMIYWQEVDKTTVVHVEDFSKMHSYSNITTPTGDFYNLDSPMKLVKK